jgi:cytochrome c oxidase cbb3-type subunit 3
MSEENNQDKVRSGNYDGIQEYDNSLPKWWLVTFLITIIFAFIYWSRYFVFESAPNQTKELIQQMDAVEEKVEKTQGLPSSEDLLAMSKDPAALDHGSTVYKNNCVACHGTKGEGGIGPNLTDNAWIHGGDPENIEYTITNGVIEKGMTPWKGILSPKQILQVAAYVMSMEGSNPPNPKAPQGEPKAKK